jgi:hypothetical protein
VYLIVDIILDKVRKLELVKLLEKFIKDFLELVELLKYFNEFLFLDKFFMKELKWFLVFEKFIFFKINE